MANQYNSLFNYPGQSGRAKSLATYLSGCKSARKNRALEKWKTMRTNKVDAHIYKVWLISKLVFSYVAVFIFFSFLLTMFVKAVVS